MSLSQYDSTILKRMTAFQRPINDLHLFFIEIWKRQKKKTFELKNENCYWYRNGFA